MTTSSNRIFARSAAAIALGGALVFSPVLSPLAAYADQAAADSATANGGAPAEDDSKPLSELQKKVDETAKAYDSATQKVNDLQKRMDENEAKIAQIEKDLPAQQEKAAQAMSASYKFHADSGSLLGMVLGSENLSEFLSTVTALDRIQSQNKDAIDALNKSAGELKVAKASIESDKKSAQSEQQKASEALKQAEAVRQEAQKKAEEKAAAEAKKQAEEAAKAKAAQEAAQQQGQSQQQPQQQAAGNGSNGTAQGNGGSGQQAAQQQATTPTSTPNTGEVNYDSGKAAFVAKWQPRIDAYLAGSPMAGTGRTFAEAAWDNGVDPRWSPAIATIESGKGRAVAGPHNAWGWRSLSGWRSFGSWDEGIRAHVAYLMRMYGPSLTISAAKTYCPPTYMDWYNSVSSEMNKI